MCDRGIMYDKNNNYYVYLVTLLWDIMYICIIYVT